MLDLLIILLVVIPLVLISYKIGRKKKKVEAITMLAITLCSIFISIMLYFFLHYDFLSYSTNAVPLVESITDFDY